MAMGRILIIEDDADLLSALRDMLSGAGHEVRVASSAPAAMREYRQHGADVIITDLFIPDVDGLALIRELGAEVTVIAISGGGQLGQPDVLQDAEEFGAWRTLQKPFTRAQLVALVSEALAR